MKRTPPTSDFDWPIAIAEISYPIWLQDTGDTGPNLSGADSLHRRYPATLGGQQRFMNDVVHMTLQVAALESCTGSPQGSKCATR